MSLDFCAIPLNVRYNICHFVVNPSLLQLRQVNKLVKNTVDMLVTTKNSTAGAIEIATSVSSSENGIAFFFNKTKDCILWTFCFFNVLKRLGIMKAIFSNQRMLQVWLDADIYRQFLKNLKPMLSKLHILSLHHLLYDFLHHDVIGMIAEFLEGKRVGCVFEGKILTNPSEMKAWLDFVKKVRPTWVNFRIEKLTNESAHFLISLSNIATFMKIHLRNSHEIVEIISIISEMMNRNCKELNFGFDVTSGQCAEKIVQFIHHLGRRMSISAWYNNSDNSHIIRVGECIVKTDNGIQNIRHTESTIFN